jgi:hypothetical protein
MKPRTEKSLQLYDVMLKRGYPKEFSPSVRRKALVEVSVGASR